MNRRFFLPIAAIALVVVGCPRASPSQSVLALNTICSITLYDQARAGVYLDVFNRLSEIESRMSAYLPDSDIARINAAAGIAPVEVHDDVFEVVERALHFAEISGGAFDPTVGPLVALWDIGGDSPRIPPQAEIDAVLPLVNWRNVELDRQRRSVFLRRPGMALDLGAIAKGYAADEAAAIIRKARLRQAIVDLGGNVLTIGRKKGGAPWRVGIQNPFETRGGYVGVVESGEQAVVTSGVYERYFMDGGQRYHHLFSPSSGYPARSGLLSVSIVTGNSTTADALSTAVFVMGYERGRALVESLPGVEALFVFEDMSVRKTGGLNFTLAHDDYRLIN